MKNSFGFITKIGETVGILFIVNILWVFTVLIGLGITVGAANTAAYTVMRKFWQFEDEVMLHNCGSIYFKALKENFKTSTFIWIISVVIFAMIFFNIKFSLIGYGKFGIILQGFQVIVLIQLIFVNIYCYSMMSYFEARLSRIVYSSLLLSNAHLFTTLTCLAVAVGLIVTLNSFNYLTIFILFSAYIGVTAFIFKPIFKKYSIETK